MGKALLKGGQCCLSCFSCLLSYFKLKSLSGGLRTGVLWEFGVLLTQEVCKLQKRNASGCELELVTPRTGSAKDPQRGLLSLMNLSGCEPGLGGFNFYFNFLLFMYFFGCTRSLQKFPGQGPHPSHSSDSVDPQRLGPCRPAGQGFSGLSTVVTGTAGAGCAGLSSLPPGRQR